MKEMVGGCCVCSDERGWPDNALVYCDGNGCTVAVHQACYGIIAVPAGPWYCRKCEITDRTQRVRCTLCPSRSGALKRADTGGWAHVVCALYIPEVRFGNVTSMEPIILQLIPPERYNKLCCICQEAGKLRRAAAGACMQCNKSGCKQQFHVTCAQGLGLLCEEAGNYLDNVKYCGYCQYHYSKLKKGSSTVKTPYKPVHDDSQESDSGETEERERTPQVPAGDNSATGPSMVAVASTSTTSAATSKTKSRKSSSSAAAPGKSTPTTSRSSSDTPVPSTSGTSGEKTGKKSSPVGESSGRRTSAASDASPAPPTPLQRPTTPQESSAQAPKASEQSATGTAVTQEPSAAENTSSPTFSSEPASAAAPTVISSTEYHENKHTKKRKAATQTNTSAPAASEYRQQSTPVPASTPPVPAAAANTSPKNPPSQHTEVPMEVDAAEKAKKAKTESPVIVPPGSHTSPSQQQSPGHRGRPASVGNIRSPSRGGGGGGGRGERTPPQPSLLVSVPLPSTSHDLGFTMHSQVAGTSNEAPTAHSFYQLQKQAQSQQAQSLAASGGAGASSRLSWGGLNVYEMQQQDHFHKTAEKRPEPSPMPAPVRNKKRAAMNSSTLTHSNTTPSELSPGAMVSASKMPQAMPPPLAPPQLGYQESPTHSPGAERPRALTVEQLQRMHAAQSLAPHMLGNEINLNSTAAECLSEQLNAELAAHASGQRSSPDLQPPPPPERHYEYSRSAFTAASSGGTQTLEQLLERQWEQGSQYIMERAKNFDIASLLSCLHQLRTENVRLEEQVGSLMQRKETLLAVNARLANPLSAGTAPSPESGRCSRDSSRPPSVMRNDPSMNAERSSQLMMQQKPS